MTVVTKKAYDSEVVLAQVLGEPEHYLMCASLACKLAIKDPTGDWLNVAERWIEAVKVKSAQAVAKAKSAEYDQIRDRTWGVEDAIIGMPDPELGELHLELIRNPDSGSEWIAVVTEDKLVVKQYQSNTVAWGLDGKKTRYTWRQGFDADKLVVVCETGDAPDIHLAWAGV